MQTLYKSTAKWTIIGRLSAAFDFFYRLSHLHYDATHAATAGSRGVRSARLDAVTPADAALSPIPPSPHPHPFVISVMIVFCFYSDYSHYMRAVYSSPARRLHLPRRRIAFAASICRSAAAFFMRNRRASRFAQRSRPHHCTSRKCPEFPLHLTALTSLFSSQACVECMRRRDSARARRFAGATSMAGCLLRDLRCTVCDAQSVEHCAHAAAPWPSYVFPFLVRDVLLIRYNLVSQITSFIAAAGRDARDLR